MSVPDKAQTGRGRERKSVVICTHAFPPDTGGIAAFARDFAHLFEEGGYEVLVSKSKRTGRFGFYFGIFLNFWTLFKRCFKEKPRLILCSRLLPWGPSALAVGKLLGIKVVFQIHGSEIAGRSRIGFRRKLRCYLYNRATQVWTNSTFTKKLAEGFGCRKDLLRVVYPFLTRDAIELASAITPSKGDREEGVKIVTAAHLYPRKGIDLVLKALAMIKDLSWSYNVAGGYPTGIPGAPSDGYYEKLADELGIADRTRFLGHVDRKKLWEQMADSDVFVMASRASRDDLESFGIVYIEAQMFGIPCIGTDFGGIPEAIGDAGHLVRNEDVEDLADRLRELIERKKERESLGVRGRNRVREGFTSRARWEEIENLLMEMGLSPK